METPLPPHLDLGSVRLRWLNGGAFRLDGAAVFGQLARPAWSALLAPDEDNRVALAAHVVLVETSGEFGLIETGIPHTLTPRQQGFLQVERESSIEADLAVLGIARQDIRFVILTHLHPDHAGGVTTARSDGSRGATFPNARHVVQRLEVETLHDLGYPWRHTLDADGFGILFDGGLVEQVDGEAVVAPSVRVWRTGGHTSGHQAVIIEGEASAAICLGDLLPTRYHLDPVCVPAVDDFPLDSIAIKRVELARAAEFGTWLIVAHDCEVLALRCQPDGTVASELRLPATTVADRNGSGG
jgi:glyoxylase-like metal-dependent hydrolase (beta-lactamase superfamily II)